MRAKNKRIYKKVRVYSADFRENAIQLALRSSSIEVVAKKLNIPTPTSYTWVTNFKKGQPSKQNAGLMQPKLETL